MQVKINTPLIAVLISLLLVMYPTRGGSQTLVTKVNELSRPTYDSIHVKSHSTDGIFISYKIAIDKEEIVVSNKIGNNQEVVGRFYEKTYPNLDLSSFEAGYDRRKKKATITLSFGNRRSCFSNYDGRDSVTFEFLNNSITTHIQVLNCILDKR